MYNALGRLETDLETDNGDRPARRPRDRDRPHTRFIQGMVRMGNLEVQMSQNRLIEGENAFGAIAESNGSSRHTTQ